MIFILAFHTIQQPRLHQHHILLVDFLVQTSLPNTNMDSGQRSEIFLLDDMDMHQ